LSNKLLKLLSVYSLYKTELLERSSWA